MQRKAWIIIIVLLITNVVLATRLWTGQPVPVEAANATPQQAAGQEPSLTLYMLLNQPGPLWLAGIDLSQAKLQYAALSSANLIESDLSDADLRKANLQEADLRKANLAGANLQETYLEKAYLEEANLAGAYLAGAYLAGAYLGRADLSGAYLSGANLKDADLKGAVYDDKTEWPVDFDAEAAGAIDSSKSSGTGQ